MTKLSFDALASMGRRGMKVINSAVPKSKKTEEEGIQFSLGSWARDDACREIFIPKLLNKWIKGHEQKQMEFIGNHSLLTYHKGIADGLKTLRAYLTKCADPSE